MLPVQLNRNEDELAIIKAIAESSDDGPILMLNLNRYRPGAGFPGVGLHKDYIDGLEKVSARRGRRNSLAPRGARASRR